MNEKEGKTVTYIEEYLLVCRLTDTVWMHRKTV